MAVVAEVLDQRERSLMKGEDLDFGSGPNFFDVSVHSSAVLATARSSKAMLVMMDSTTCRWFRKGVLHSLPDGLLQTSTQGHWAIECARW